ncbi:MAG TPA: patatin-like phospholipase family protein [Burkholderiales bacterium]|nr:patatin-like phospholipase family protein [Burkholderiales bacterium]
MPKKRVTLALQGGGSHGAFTWGVLDRLLEDERIEIEGISGASAGAINAVVLAHGVTVGGREGGRRALETFWRSVASRAPLNLVPGSWAGIRNRAVRDVNPAVNALVLLARFLSPRELNPLDLNPLREILATQLDFPRIRADSPIKLFVAATRVATGESRIFANGELNLEVLLASACLPSLNRPIEIDGEAYWDGGLTANPPLQPLLYECETPDLLIVLLHPLRRTGIPTAAEEIAQRLTEISFTSTVGSELRGIALAKQEAARNLIPLGRLDRKLRGLNLHLIASQGLMSRLSVLSKLNTDSGFIEVLRRNGRARAAAWLKKNFGLIGERSSFVLAGI